MKISLFFVLSAIAYSSSLVLALPVQSDLTSRDVLNPSDNLDAREVSDTSAVELTARDLEFEELSKRSPQAVSSKLEFPRLTLIMLFIF